MLAKVRFFLYNKTSVLRGFLHQIRDSISNLIFWFPVILKDRNYDEAFFFRILAFKLKRIQNHLSKVTISDFENEIADLDNAIFLAEKIANYDYAEFGLVDINFQEDKEAFQKCVSVYTSAEKERNKDIDTLFTIIKEKNRGWWY